MVRRGWAAAEVTRRVVVRPVSPVICPPAAATASFSGSGLLTRVSPTSRPLTSATRTARNVYGSRQLSGNDFPATSTATPTWISTTTGRTRQGLEFRTLYTGQKDLYLDRVHVFRSPRPRTSTVEWTLPGGDGWERGKRPLHGRRGQPLSGVLDAECCSTAPRPNGQGGMAQRRRFATACRVCRFRAHSRRPQWMAAAPGATGERSA